MKVTEYITYDALGLAQLIKQKQIKAHEPLECAIQLTDTYNPQLNAVVATYYEKAHQQLEKFDPNSPLYGVPSLVKDLYFSIKGTRETNGSQFFSNNTSRHSCEYVLRMMAAGTLIFGKTNTAELGLSFSCEPKLFGACHNPWNLSLTSGGSSGGSASAVAARIVPFAAGNDSGGSLRTPAACCGLFGLKPTRGSTPHNPNQAEMWSGLLTNHVVTRSVRDSAAVLDLMQNPYNALHPRKENPYSESNVMKNKQPLKIALLTGVFPQVDIAEPCQRAVDLATVMTHQLGHHIEPVRLSIDIEKIDQAVFTIIAANTLKLLRQQQSRCGRQHNAKDIEPITNYFAEQGHRFSTADMQAAKHIIHTHVNPINQLLQHYDVLLTPALAQPPLTIGSLSHTDELKQFMKKCMQFSPFTSLFNQTGQPAMTLPVLFDNEDQPPVSVQFAARHLDEATLFRLAYQFEQANPWQQHLPTFVQKF
ncbi:MAG: amidase family protein [Coxiellaceae bacterium]|nr:amidase family protein [Coxiellaceae bacterium]